MNLCKKHFKIYLFVIRIYIKLVTYKLKIRNSASTISLILKLKSIITVDTIADG